jgi:pentatricopeptide repeat protein
MDKYNVRWDTLTCNIMISIYGDMLSADRIVWVLSVMREQRIAMDAFTYSAAINGCIKANELKEAMLISAEAMESPLLLTSVYVLNAVMSAYSVNRQWQEALAVFLKAVERHSDLDTASYTIVINALAEAREFEVAERIFLTMTGGQSTPRPDVLVYSAMMTACERTKRWEDAKRLLARMEREGLAPNGKVMCSIISCCGAAGRWREAVEAFRDMDRMRVAKDGAIYNALINALKSAGQWTLAIDVLRESTHDSAINQVDYLSSEEAGKLAREIYSLGLTEGALDKWYRDEEQRIVLDLHSLSIAVAITVVSLLLEELTTGSLEPARLRVITGRGNHINNSGTRGVLRTEIEAYLAQKLQPTGLLTVERVPGNDGCIEIPEASVVRWIAAAKQARTPQL